MGWQRLFGQTEAKYTDFRIVIVRWQGHTMEAGTDVLEQFLHTGRSVRLSCLPSGLREPLRLFGASNYIFFYKAGEGSAFILSSTQF